MYYLGCDVGSLTAKAVILDGRSRRILASAIIPSQSSGRRSNQKVIGECLARAGLGASEIGRMCSTGYGSFENPYESDGKSELSCHGMGVFHLRPDVRTVIDVGGQDTKVMALDGRGLVDNFRMNSKCAAGTGRILEILAEKIGISVEEMGEIPLCRRTSITISNRCGIFMEMDVVKHLRAGRKTKEIVHAVADAVSRRITQLVTAVGVKPQVAMSGGVSKNRSIVRRLEQELGVEFVQLPYDAQLMGAVGASVFAMMEGERVPREG